MQLLERCGSPDQYPVRRSTGKDRTRRGRLGNRGDNAISPRGQSFNEQRLFRAVSERAAHGKDLFLHSLRLDRAPGPDGFEQIIVRDELPGVLDQIREDRESFRAQQYAFLATGIAASPETLVRDVEAEWGKDFHWLPAGHHQHL